METGYPAEGEVSICVEPYMEKEFEIRLRIPSFVESGTVSVNGEAAREARAGTFLQLNRVWKRGDGIRLSLVWEPRLVFGMENPEDPGSARHVAVLYGPLALARDKRLGAEAKSVTLGDGSVSVQRVPERSVPCQCRFDVTMGGEIFPMIDYASAGKTWRRDSEMEVWMETQ